MKRHVVRKTFLLDPSKVSRAQKVLGAASETKAVRMALDKVIDEDRDERKRLKAHREFLKILDSEESNPSTVEEKEPAREARPQCWLQSDAPTQYKVMPPHPACWLHSNVATGF